MAVCKKCLRPIVWIETPRGRKNCLDPEYIPYRANSQGKDYLVSDSGEVIRCTLFPDNKVPKGEFPTGMARRAHWATCPFADDFRKGKKEAD